MKRNGTDPNTGYSVYVYEAGDIMEGTRIQTRSGEWMSVKRCGVNHVLCHSWPQDVIVKYSDIKDHHYTEDILDCMFA